MTEAARFIFLVVELVKKNLKRIRSQEIQPFIKYFSCVIVNNVNRKRNRYLYFSWSAEIISLFSTAAGWQYQMTIIL